MTTDRLKQRWTWFIALELYLCRYQLSKMRHASYVTLLALLLVASPANASLKSLILFYDVYVGGFKVVEIELEAEVRAKKYSVEISLKGVKVFNIFVSWHMRLLSEGKIIEGVPIPRKASAYSRWRGKNRLTSLEYDEFGALKSTKISPVEKEGSRSPVTEQMKSGARDLSTGLLYLLNKLDLTQQCAMKEPIFDGKRAFLIKLMGGEPTVLGVSQLSAFKGDALKCNVVLKQLGGYRVDPEYATRRLKGPITIWFGKPFSKFFYIPVKMELETSLGWLVAHLAKAEFKHLGKKYQLGVKN